MYHDMLTIEDMNTVIAKNPYFNRLYKINTGLLPSSSFTEKYYDFTIIQMTKTTTGADKYYSYKIEVYNILWTGGLTFGRIEGNNIVSVNSENILNHKGEPYIITVTVKNTTNFDIYLVLNNDDESERKVYHSALRFKDKINDLTYVYNESKSIDLVVVNTYGTPKEGVTVKLLQGDILHSQANTDINGKVSLSFKSLPPNNYVFHLVAEQTGNEPHTQYFNVNILKEEPFLNLTLPTTYKGGFSTINMKVTTVGTPNISPQVRVECKDNNYGQDTLIPLSPIDTHNYNGDYEANYRGLRNDRTSIKFIVEETPYTSKVERLITLNLQTYTATTWDDIKEQATNPYGTDLIQILQGNITAGSTIELEHNLELTGEQGNSWATIQNGTHTLFKFKGEPDNWIIFKCNNIQFLNNTDGVIYVSTQTDIDIRNCYFKNNTNNDYIGTCIKHNISPYYLDGSYFKAHIKGCTFENNKGGAVAFSSNTKFEDNIIIINNNTYIQDHEPFAYHQYSQEATLINNDFVMDLDSKVTLPIHGRSNFLFGLRPFFLHKSTLLNSKYASDMCRDDSLNYNNNKGYIRVKFDLDSHEVTASPKTGYERECFAHLIGLNEGDDYTLGYYNDNLTIQAGDGNTRRKPVYHPPINNKAGRGYIE